MKALVYNGPGLRSWEEVPDPELHADGDVVVKISSSTICGTDLHILKGDVPEATPGTILGHEGIGTVVKKGAELCADARRPPNAHERRNDQSKVLWTTREAATRSTALSSFPHADAAAPRCRTNPVTRGCLEMKRLATILTCALASLVVTGTSSATPGAATLASQGVVQWRFQVSGQYVLHPPAVGPDGGVVVASSTGDVYSLTAAGALRWVVPFVGGSGGPSISPDGTVYVSSMSTVTAIAADGSIRWSFTEPSVGQGVIAGPTVGPDGNIYVISDYGGLGAFALSPAGQLLWSNPGTPTFSEYGQLGAEIVFGSGRLYAAFDEYAVAASTIFGVSLGGNQQWARPLAGSDDMFMQQQRQPATGSDGSLYLAGMGGASGWSLYRVDPGSGNVLWNYSPWPSNGMSAPSVGPDGSVYFSRSLSYLESVTPAGRSRWTFFDGSIIDHPAVSPDGNVVVGGVRPNFGQPGSIRGWNAATGTVAWQVDLPNENGGYQVLYTPLRFSADSRTGYFGTAILAGGEEYSFLYAVATGTGAPTAVPLAAFAARPTAGTVVLSWQTESELDVLGFDVWRHGRNKAARKLNPTLIAAKRTGQPIGATYRLVDRTVRRGIGYTYRLQLVRTDGSRMFSRSIRLSPR